MDYRAGSASPNALFMSLLGAPSGFRVRLATPSFSPIADPTARRSNLMLATHAPVSATQPLPQPRAERPLVTLLMRRPAVPVPDNLHPADHLPDLVEAVDLGGDDAERDHLRGGHVPEAVEVLLRVLQEAGVGGEEGGGVADGVEDRLEVGGELRAGAVVGGVLAFARCLREGLSM